MKKNKLLLVLSTVALMSLAACNGGSGKESDNSDSSISSSETVKETYDLFSLGVSFEDQIVTYDGQEHELVIKGTLPEGVTVTYTNNKITNVGELEVTATFTVDANHNPIPDKTAKITVVPAEYDMSDVKFSDKKVAYDGEEHTLEITGNLPAGVSVTYTNNVLSDVGSIEVTATFTGDTNHNTIASMKATLTITKATFDMSGVSFNDLTVPYDGEEHVLRITGTLPVGVSVRYSNNKLTDVGELEVTATFVADTENHEEIAPMKATLKVTKLVYDMSGVAFEGKTVNYTGNSVELPAVTGTLPTGVTVAYSATDGEGNPVESIVEPGLYIVTAAFTGDSNHEAIESKRCFVTVNKGSIDVSSFAIENKTVTYNGEAQSIVATNIPANTSVTYTYYNEAFEVVNAEDVKNAGKYLVNACLTGTDNDDYNPVHVNKTAVLTIEKANHDVANMAWPTKTAFAYDGTAKKLELENVPSTLTVTYTYHDASNNVVADPTELGTYTVTATFADNGNYNSVSPMSATMTIETILPDTVKFDAVTAEYNGSAIAGPVLDESTLPEWASLTGIVVTNESGTVVDANNLIEPGVYTFTASFTSSNPSNPIADLTSTLTINKRTVEIDSAEKLVAELNPRDHKYTGKTSSYDRYVLTADITLNPDLEEGQTPTSADWNVWESTGCLAGGVDGKVGAGQYKTEQLFSAEIDGQGHTIKNLYLTKYSIISGINYNTGVGDCAARIGFIQDPYYSYIHDLTFEHPVVDINVDGPYDGVGSSAAIVESGILTSEGRDGNRFENITFNNIDANVVAGKISFGAITGVDVPYVDVTSPSSPYIKDDIGLRKNIKVTNSKINAEVIQNADCCIGGITGKCTNGSSATLLYEDCSVTNTTFDVKTSGASNACAVGAIVGYNKYMAADTIKLSNCSSNATINIVVPVGRTGVTGSAGLFGYNTYSTIYANCTNNVNVTIKGADGTVWDGYPVDYSTKEN